MFTRVVHILIVVFVRFICVAAGADGAASIVFFSFSCRASRFLLLCCRVAIVPSVWFELLCIFARNVILVCFLFDSLLSPHCCMQIQKLKLKTFN